PPPWPAASGRRAPSLPAALPILRDLEELHRALSRCAALLLQVHVRNRRVRRAQVYADDVLHDQRTRKGKRIGGKLFIPRSLCPLDRKSTRLNASHVGSSDAGLCW